MWFFKLKDFFIPSDEEIELMIKNLGDVSGLKSKTDQDCCDPRHHRKHPDTVGE